MKTTTPTQETEIGKTIEKIKQDYGTPPLAPGVPLRLAVDGLSENPGKMGGGIYLRQGESVLAAETLFLGYGSCNEAEYLALLNGLRITQALYPNPGVPVIAQSDSQLVVHQVLGTWKARNRMKDFCRALMRMQSEYPYRLIQVPREENEMADGLAQVLVLKHSGRALSLENGRFDRSKQAMAKGKTSSSTSVGTSPGSETSSRRSAAPRQPPWSGRPWRGRRRSWPTPRCRTRGSRSGSRTPSGSSARV
jgi:ribonuclease HI